MLGRLV